MNDPVATWQRFAGVSRSVLEHLVLSLEQDRDTYVEALTRVQSKCTEQLEELRAWRRLLSALSNPTLHTLDNVALERCRQDEKWGPIGEADLAMPDGTGHPGDAQIRDQKQADCEAAAPLTLRHILDEEVAEAFAETDRDKLRAELIQVAAVACKWVEILDRRVAR